MELYFLKERAIMTVQCPICFKKDALLSSSRLCLYQCPSCTHTFTLPQDTPQEHYDEEYFQEEHKNWFNNPNIPLFDFIYERALRLLGAKEMNILDVGCGKGDFLKYVASKNSNASLCGIDFEDNQHPRIQFIKGDLMETPLKRKFTVITTLAVIEHMENPHLFLQKVNDLLEPGGYFFTMTINNYSLLNRIARLLAYIGVHSASDRLYSIHHLQHYSNKSLRTLLEMNGFETLLQKNHNRPFKAVDVPRGNTITVSIYKLVVYVLFFISEPLGLGMDQTLISKRKG
jgi:2-polyprenyl-3-methyl-5-hydroxy-6-metoxy-1,4-benzoquinol methylase